jgi:hypothetical protein
LYPLGSPFIVTSQTRESADRAAGLAAHELERIGILLLRHHAAAGADASDSSKNRALRREDDQVLCDAAEVHHRE